MYVSGFFYYIMNQILHTVYSGSQLWDFKVSSHWTRMKGGLSTCDKWSTKCLSLGCHGNQGPVLFNPAYT